MNATVLYIGACLNTFDLTWQVVLFNRDGEPCTDVAKFNPWHRNVTCGVNGGTKCAVAEPFDSPYAKMPFDPLVMV